MRAAYILLVLVVAASVPGCIDKTGPDSSLKAPVSNTPVSPSETPAPLSSVAENDEFGLDNDLAQIDPMVNELEMNISFSEISANAFI
ncbi:MAG: hypothetical protein FIB08_13410 [Candidatus Methanoperedens sp.]|nr:hypothetical protein [Candidatus Methanoperedens sp.]